jgi:tRNA-specific 2-thiouridylase
MKIAVAMSGGVDSSVAAALLKEEGHDVIGVTMRLYAPSHIAPDASEDAQKVADKLGIPHHVIDLQDIFARKVINDFCREYSKGRTPNPCVLCNREIKFGALWERVRGLGAEFLATGHYARVEKDKTGTYHLKKGKDKSKDQSYFLCRLTQEQLSRTMFPIGGLTKVRVRQIAQKMGLPTASRPESQEICFVPDNDHAGFLKEHIQGKFKPGAIIDQYGNYYGPHQGIAFYTIGQRKGLHVAAGVPLYVIRIAPGNNVIIIGDKEQTYASELAADNLNWIDDARQGKPIKVKARIRYRHEEADAIVCPLNDDNVYVKFDEPQMAITPGQTIVFYDGEKVMGGGRIIQQGR